MDTNVNRIAGLWTGARPKYALVVLVREGERWNVESARTADNVGSLGDPGCPVVLDATGFWQDASHAQTTDAELLQAIGWNVRAPVTVEGRSRNPLRVEMQANLDEMIATGQLQPVLMLDLTKMDALRLAAWGARQASEQLAAAQFRANLLPWQQATCEQLDAWLASNEVLAIVIGEHRSGKSYVVESWAKATGRRVEMVRPTDDVERVKFVRCDLMLLNAGHHDRRTIANAIMGGKVVLVADPPTRDKQEWLRDLVEAVQADGSYGRVIECVAPPIDQEARRRAELIAAIIDPEAR